MTKQEIFDTVVLHLRAQGKKSPFHGSYGSCVYRGVSGTKCAIGCLIPDEDFNPEWEGCTPLLHGTNGRMNIQFNRYCIVKFGEDNLPFLEQLQDIHDSNKVEEWEQCFKSIARNHSLNLPD